MTLDIPQPPPPEAFMHLHLYGKNQVGEMHYSLRMLCMHLPFCPHSLLTGVWRMKTHSDCFARLLSLYLIATVAMAAIGF